MISNSIKIQKENLKGGIFLLPGVGLLLCFGILPICLAFYMSLHRWKPVQGRFMGLSHYEKAIGDLTSAMLTLTALAMLIVGIWLLTRNWKQTPAKHSLTLCYAVGATMVVLLSWRVFELNHYVTAFQEGEAWALKMKRDMFLDRRGDPSEQLALLSGHANVLLGSALMTVLAFGLHLYGFFRKKVAWLRGIFPGVILLYASSQVISVNWEKMMASGDDDFLNSLVHTVFFSTGTVTLQISLGLMIAFALYRKLRGFAFFRFLVFLPYVTPVVAMATVFSLIFGARESSLSNQFLAMLGVEPLRWIADNTPITEYLFGVEWSGLFAGPSLGMVTAILFGVWSYTGYNAVILLAGLTAIPGDLYEAAEMEGATAWQSFRHITMPLLSPVIFFLVITGLIGTFQAFTHIYFMLSSTVNKSLHVGSIEIWRQISLGKFGYSSALAVILFVLIILLTVAQFSLFSRHQHFGD